MGVILGLGSVPTHVPTRASNTLRDSSRSSAGFRQTTAKPQGLTGRLTKSKLQLQICEGD